MGVEVMIISAMVAGTAMQAYGQYQAGKDAQKAADYNAQIMKRNANVAEQKAAYEAEAEASRLRRLIGSQRAAAGASGYQMTGSILDLQEDTTTQGTMEQMAILYGGQLQKQNFESEAELSTFQGKAAYRQGVTGAAGTLLSGGAQSAFMGRQMGMYGTKTSSVTVGKPTPAG